jgi:hypothetical protein
MCYDISTLTSHEVYTQYTNRTLCTIIETLKNSCESIYILIYRQTKLMDYNILIMYKYVTTNFNIIVRLKESVEKRRV